MCPWLVKCFNKVWLNCVSDFSHKTLFLALRMHEACGPASVTYRVTFKTKSVAISSI